MTSNVLPRRPREVSTFALACLSALSDAGLASTVSIGGGFGLLHYLDHRTTRDVDAWWSEQATPDLRLRVLDLLEKTLASFGEVSVKAWGEVASLKLRVQGELVFGFEIASRSALLEPVRPAPWIAVCLDSLDDLMASKMVALVERGAPRDFHDVYAACRAGLVSPSQCWELWRRRQDLAGSDTSAPRARLALQTHLGRIEQHRRLVDIPEPEKRAEARVVRTWFRKEFLDALPKA